MKKYLLSLIVILLIILCISACGNKQTTNTSNNSNNNSNSSTNTDSILLDSTETNNNDNKVDVNSSMNSTGHNNVSLSVAEKRKLKVSFNMIQGNYGPTSDKRIIAIMGENEEGNEQVVYSPNAYQFYVSIACKDTLDEALEVVQVLIDSHFDGLANGGSPTTVIDVIKNTSSNTATVLFPDFDSYYLCQENLLNGLSEKNSVLSIQAGYIDVQNGTTSPTNIYEYINVGRSLKENRHIKSYDEFISLLDNKIETNEELQKITPHTFENSYVFVVVNLHHREFDISDAKLIGNTIYFTTNCYGIHGELVDAIEHFNACITIVPKEELGELPQEVTARSLEIFLLTDERDDNKTE